jgi:hypothetical protein
MGASPSPIPVPVWMVACASALQSQNLTGSFVDQYGHPMSAFNNDTWGVTQTACYEVCGTDKMYQVREGNFPFLQIF